MEDIYNNEFNYCIEELNIQSYELWEQSQNYEGRGIFILAFKNITEFLNRTEWPLIFIPEKYITELNLSKEYYENYKYYYDKNNNIAILIIVTIDKKLIKEDKNDGIFKLIVIGKDNYKNTKKTIKNPIKVVKDIDILNSMNICNNCNKKVEKKYKCGRCLSVVYCDKICQTNAWSIHKIICKELKNKYDYAKSFLNK